MVNFYSAIYSINGSSGKCVPGSQKGMLKESESKVEIISDFQRRGFFDMSTSLLYHAFGIVGYFYQSTCFIAGVIVVAIQADHWRLRCPVCKSREIHYRGKLVRRFRTVPIGQKAVFIDLPVQRVECTQCQAVRQVKIQFADERKRYTRSFERLVLDLSKHMTIQAVARHLGVSWDLVKGIQKDNLNKRYRLPKLAKIKRIALDTKARSWAI